MPIENQRITQMVVVSDPKRDTNAMLQLVALFNEDGTPYSAPEGPSGGGGIFTVDLIANTFSDDVTIEVLKSDGSSQSVLIEDLPVDTTILMRSAPAEKLRVVGGSELAVVTPDDSMEGVWAASGVNTVSGSNGSAVVVVNGYSYAFDMTINETSSDEIVKVAGYVEMTESDNINTFEEFVEGPGIAMAGFVPPNSGFNIIVKLSNGSAYICDRNGVSPEDPAPHWDNEELITIAENVNKLYKVMIAFNTDNRMFQVFTADITTYILVPATTARSEIETIAGEVIDAALLEGEAIAEAIADGDEYNIVGNVKVYAVIDCLEEFDPIMDGSMYDGEEPEAVCIPAPGIYVANQDWVWVSRPKTHSLRGMWRLVGPGQPWVRPNPSDEMYNGFEFEDLLKLKTGRQIDITTGDIPFSPTYGITWTVSKESDNEDPELFSNGYIKSGVALSTMTVDGSISWLADGVTLGARIPSYVKSVCFNNVPDNEENTVCILDPRGSSCVVRNRVSTGSLSVLDDSANLLGIIKPGMHMEFYNSGSLIGGWTRVSETENYGLGDLTVTPGTGVLSADIATGSNPHVGKIGIVIDTATPGVLATISWDNPLYGSVVTMSPAGSLNGLDWWVESDETNILIYAANPVDDSEYAFNWSAVSSEIVS